MSFGYAIVGALILFVIGIYSLVTKLRNRPILHSANSSKDPKRSTDKRHLTRHETKILDQAKSLMGQNRVLQASRLLESIGLERDAIAVLETNKHIHEAAQILMRMRRPNRAGIVYARNGYWTNAAECFVLAGMYYEAAKASLESSDFPNAAILFEKAGKFEEAAKSYIKSKLHLEAGRAYLKASQQEAAVQCFIKKFSDDPSFDKSQLTSTDKDAMVKWLSSGSFDERIVSIVQGYGQLHKPVLEFYRSGQYKKAVPLLVKAKTEDINRIMLDINYEDSSYVNLAKAFEESGMVDRAGMIFEAGGKFDEAARNFEQYGDLERAYYCYERAGDSANSSRLRSKNSKVKTQSSGPSNGFVLGEDSQLSELNQNLSLSNNTAFLDRSDDEQVRDPFSELGLEAESTTKSELPSSPQPTSLAFGKQSANQLSDFKMYIDDPDDSSSLDSSSSSSNGNTRHRNLSANSFLSTSLEKTEHFDSGKNLLAGFSKEESRYVTPTHKNFFNCSIFVDLNRDECELIWNVGETIEIGANEVLYDGTSNLEGMYVVLEGKLSCTKSGKTDSKPSGSISVSDSFGELVVLADYQTPIQLFSVSKCKVWYCSASKFEQALFSHGSISTKIYKYYLSKLLTRLTQQSKAG